MGAGVCFGQPHTTAFTVEEMILDPPFERDIIKGQPVVYVKQPHGKSTKLLTFTTSRPMVVGITAIWNEVRYLHLGRKDPNEVIIVVGENPRFRGVLDNIREVSGEIFVDIEEFNGEQSLGCVGQLRVEITQHHQAPPPPRMPLRTFRRKGYDANLSVFLYEGRNVSKRMVSDRKSHDPQFEVDLVIYNPHGEDEVRTPNPAFIDPSSMKKGRKFCPVWNQGFHWTNITTEPRFLDVRINPKADDYDKKATCRVDLLKTDVWSKGQTWQWHPIRADDHRDQRRYRVLVVDDDEENALELQRILTVLSCDARVENDCQLAFSDLMADDLEYFETVDLIFVNIRQKTGMDGITFGTKIREIESREQMEPTTLICLDVEDPNGDIDKDRKVLQGRGFDDLIWKPLDKDAVRWVLHRYVSNLGTMLLDIVVIYTPHGVSPDFHQIPQMADFGMKSVTRVPDKLTSAADRDREAKELDETKAAETHASQPPREGASLELVMNGLLELRILSAVLNRTIPQDYSLVYIVTLNHKVLETKQVKRATLAPLVKGEPIVWDEPVRLWIHATDLNDRSMTLGIALYAYPAGSSSWNSEHLVGRWVSSDDPDLNFWESVNGEYFAIDAPLIRIDERGDKEASGHLEFHAIVRPALEIARRWLHDIYIRNCASDGTVNRGELDEVLGSLRRLLDPEDLARLEWEREVEKEAAVFRDTPKYHLSILTMLDKFVGTAAHYTPTGQVSIDEHTLMEMIDAGAISVAPAATAKSGKELLWQARGGAKNGAAELAQDDDALE